MIATRSFVQLTVCHHFLLLEIRLPTPFSCLSGEPSYTLVLIMSVCTDDDFTG